MLYVTRVDVAACLTAVMLVAFSAGSAAQEPGSIVESDARVLARSYVFPATGEEIPYALFIPSGYDESREWPLIVALHGLGRPFDWIMGYHGLVDFAERDEYIVISPLGYHRAGFYGSQGDGPPPWERFRPRDSAAYSALPEDFGARSEQDVMNVLERTLAEFNVDHDRLYLWGHSMGGAGTYHLAKEYPDLFAGLAVAAPAPPAGLDPIEALSAVRHLPILVLQGDDDPLVTRTRRWVAAMRELGLEHVYIEVPGGTHSAFISQDRDMMSKIYSFFDIVRGRKTPVPTRP